MSVDDQRHQKREGELRDEDKKSPSSLSRVLESAVDGLAVAQSSTGRASALWLKAAGARGLRHTRGVYLKEDAKHAELPTLFVYLDSPTFVYEFTTDHELYEERLAYLGFLVEKIEFRLSRSAGMPRSHVSFCDEGRPLRAIEDFESLPPLSAKTEAWARNMTQHLSPDLAQAVYGALTATLRRENKDTRTDAPEAASMDK